MTDVTPAAQEEPTTSKFKHLPEPIKLEDTITTHNPEAPSDPTQGRDLETDFMIRYGAG